MIHISSTYASLGSAASRVLSAVPVMRPPALSSSPYA
jgi:hypothetical protein